ncbi:interferon-induced very large GTPase 1-like isoform X2 [Dysidea avara]
MSPLAAYQSACQPQSPPPVRPRAKDGDSLKRRSANIQNLIQSIGLSADQISLQPHKSKGSLKRVKSCAVTTASEAEVSKLSAENFMEWLMMMGYSIQDCQAFRDNKVDGATFFLLETDELKEIVKSVETIKQLRELQKQLLGTTKISETVIDHHSLQSDFGTSTKLDDIPTPGHQKRQFDDCLRLMGLKQRFPRKLKISNIMRIREETLGNTHETEDGKVLPHLVLQKIMMFDSRCRENLFKGKINGYSALADVEEFHPLDVLIVLLHCCDNFLTQDLLSRLSTCQIAIPFLLPNPHNSNIHFLIWGMRSIIRAWKSNLGGKVVANECRVVDYASPMISFFKIGELRQSKSKIINEVISEARLDFFLHWDCEGGTADRLFVDGMAELCCYLPSGKNDANSFYSDIILFANLRGDARKHAKQTTFLQQISFMSFVLLTENSLDVQTVELLRKLNNTPGGVALMFCDLKGNEKFKNAMHEQMLSGMFVIKLKGKNNAQIRNEIRKEIVTRLQKITKGNCRSLSTCVESARTIGIQIDEDDAGCKEGKKLAENVMGKVTSVSAYEAKLLMLPLQGPNLWHKWAIHDKESYRQLAKSLTDSIDHYNIDMNKKKKSIRQDQFHFTEKPTTAMKEFLHGLLDHTGNVRLYYLCWLKMLLDDYSRKILPDLHSAYQETRTTLLKAKAENKAQTDDTDAILQLKEELKEQNERLINASLGLEHFFREMGQMYEARMDAQLKSVPKNRRNEVESFPRVVAELMSEGYPVELMDGDASHVPITWVTAVIDKMKDLHSQKQSIFVVSVLGIQSTGKSTLLNTAFGLQFNVSAGRCTRGAYFQLLPVNTTLAKRIGTDHILIVDTEGLRAPELQYKEAQKHDNELAAFVIGLADLTIINIYGETPGELTDILQTAVHAFMRMKNVDMQLSCHFVHQNVTAVMAVSKSKVGRQNFQDSLDSMTITAAKEEKCESKYSSFKDVIQFNNEKDVTMLPSLWKGDPPMAPVNPGYSYKAGTLKQAVVAAIQERKMLCSFANFQLRVKTLWSAVLQEKFVFSFKNTLEVTAYNELDTKYGQWSWELQHKVLEWRHQAGNEISSCDASVIDSIVDNCLVRVVKEINEIYVRVGEEMVEFFEKSERSQTLAQWQKSTEVRLKGICEEHKEEAKKYCNLQKRSREGRVKIDSMQQLYRQRLQVEIASLVKDAKQEKYTSKMREEIFNKQWQKWLQEISQSIPPVRHSSDKKVHREICHVLEDQYNSHGHLVTDKLTKKPLERREALHLDIDHLHLVSTRLINDHGEKAGNKLGVNGSVRRCAEINEEDVCVAKNQTNEFFMLVEEWVEEILETFQDFNKGLISNLIRILRTTIEKFNNAKANSFVFTPHYHVDMGLTVAGYSYKRFVAKLRQLDVENDPLEAMHQLKPVFFRTFDMQFSETSNDHIAVQNICSIITKPIINALIEKLQIEIVYSMKSESSHYRKKNYFKVLVLKDLAAAKTFRHFTVYLKNIANSLKYWCKVHVKQYCKTKNSKGNANLYNLSEVNLNDTISKIIDAIKYLHSQYCKKDPDAALSISDENLGLQDESVQYLDMKEWLESFHKKIKMTVAIDLQEMTDIVGIQSIHNLNFFTKQLIKSLKDESKKILLDVKNNPRATFGKLTDSAKSPHNVLYNSLIGCKEQCPFCKEQCELTDENHLDSGKPHYTEIHRPRCLAKYKHIGDNKLVLKTCTNVEADYNFKNADTNDVYFPFKEYKKIYPNWLISTESPQTGPKYWEWFIATYNTEIVEWIHAAPTPVDAEGWNSITEEDAIANLSEAYGLRTETD